ncbi:MAG: efflux RND transporter periplasmic adaptor subunit [Myxococcota bacterium]
MKKLFGILVVLVLVGLIGYRIQDKMAKNEAAAARSETKEVPAVTAEAAMLREIAPRVVITGNIRPENEVDIVTKTAGRVIAVKVKLGDKVKAGEVLALLEQDIAIQQVKQARGALEAAQANLMNARRSNESAEALGKENSISENQLIASRAGLKGAQAGVMQAEAALALAQENLENTRLTTPIDGVVTKKSVNLGAMVSPGAMGPAATLFQVQNISRLKLETSVDEREVRFIQVGQPVRFSVDALAGQTFNGKVRLISPSLDATTRRAAMEVEIDNSDGKLFAYMFAQGEILPKESQQVLAIPSSALVRGKSTPTVFVLKDDVVSIRELSTGASDGTYLAVIKGLTEGEQVVTSGQTRLTDGMQVKLNAAAAANGGGKAEVVPSAEAAPADAAAEAKADGAAEGGKQ